MCQHHSSGLSVPPVAARPSDLPEESAVRIILPRAIALSAVLLLSVACGSMSEDADAERSLTPAGLTQETFVPRVLDALWAKRSFSVEALVVPKGGRDQATFTANVRL